MTEEGATGTIGHVCHKRSCVALELPDDAYLHVLRRHTRPLLETELGEELVELRSICRSNERLR